MFVKFDFHIGAENTEKGIWFMKLLDEVRAVIREKQYSIRTEQAYVRWITRYILFHKKRHPEYLREKEISEYLSYLPTKEGVAASTQNQALNAIVFLHKQVLGMEVRGLGETERARKPERLPTGMTKDEVARVFGVMSGIYQLMAKLLYGCGLRLMECVCLWVKDDVSTTMIYTHVINKGGMGVQSPLDLL